MPGIVSGAEYPREPDFAAGRFKAAIGREALVFTSDFIRKRSREGATRPVGNAGSARDEE
jgi:hypothetical protein